MTRGRSIAWLGLAWTVVSVAMTWPLARYATSSLPAGLGDPVLNTSILAWGAERLPYGLAGWWDAPWLYPYRDTLAFSEHLLGIAIFTSPVQWLTRNPVLAYNAAFIGSFALAGAGAYVLACELGIDRKGAILVGVFFAFSPYRSAQYSHLQVLMAGWMPVCLCALHRYLRRGATADLLAFGAAYLVQALCNGYYLFFLLVPVAIVVLGAAASRRLTASRVGGLVATGVVVLIVLLPFVAAYAEARRLYGLRRTVDEIGTLSADVVSYLGIEPIWTRPWPAERMLWPGWIVVAGTVMAAVDTYRRTTIGAWRHVRPFAVLGLAVLTVVAALAHAVVLATVACIGLAAALCVPFPRSAVGIYALVAFAAALLSLGPAPTVAGQPLLTSGPYLWLYWIVPGFDGLRVTARLGMVVQLATAVLAGFGIASMTSRLSTPVRTAAVVALAVVSLAEAHGAAALAHLGPRGQPPDLPLYRWLARQPEGAVLELPIEAAGATTDRSFLYEYATLTHHKRIVNGATGYSTPLQDFLGGIPSPFTDGSPGAHVVSMLRAMGIRYVVVHQSGWPGKDDGPVVTALLRSAGDQIAGTEPFDKALVISLRPAEPWPIGPVMGAPVDASRIRTSASDMPDRLPYLFDGDPETRWLSGRPQRGDEWVDLTFDAPRDIGEVVFRVHPRSFVNYPRELTIEGIEPGGAARVLFSGTPLPLFGRGFLDSGTSVPLRILLPANQSVTLRIRQTAMRQTFFWAIDELLVSERAR